MSITSHNSTFYSANKTLSLAKLYESILPHNAALGTNSQQFISLEFVADQYIPFTFGFFQDLAGRWHTMNSRYPNIASFALVDQPYSCELVVISEFDFEVRIYTAASDTSIYNVPIRLYTMVNSLEDLS